MDFQKEQDSNGEPYQQETLYLSICFIESIKFILKIDRIYEIKKAMEQELTEYGAIQ